MQLACEGVKVTFPELDLFLEFLDLFLVGVLSPLPHNIFATSARFFADSTISGPFQPRIQEALTQRFRVD